MNIKGEYIKPLSEIGSSSAEELAAIQSFKSTICNEPTSDASHSEGSETPVEDRIHCLCRQYKDEGLMIQCEKCQVWQHCDCVGQTGEEEETYLCPKCGEREAVLDIALAPQPEYASPGEKYYASLMRCEKLQVCVGDTVYVLRAFKNKNEEGGQDASGLLKIAGSPMKRKAKKGDKPKKEEPSKQATESTDDVSLVATDALETGNALVSGSDLHGGDAADETVKVSHSESDSNTVEDSCNNSKDGTTTRPTVESGDKQTKTSDETDQTEESAPTVNDPPNKTIKKETESTLAEEIEPRKEDLQLPSTTNISANNEKSNESDTSVGYTGPNKLNIVLSEGNTGPHPNTEPGDQNSQAQSENLPSKTMTPPHVEIDESPPSIVLFIQTP